jgi:formate--tetrahydrofolate ligase
VAVSEVWSDRGEGGIELAGKVIDTLYNKKPNFKFLYSPDMGVKEKIETIARKIYGAGKIVYTVTAEDDIRIIKKLGMEDLLICMAKTPYSLSDNPQIKGRPENFKITIKQIRISAGAGFIVPVTGKITTMPGLPANPAAERMDIIKGKVEGLF